MIAVFWVWSMAVLGVTLRGDFEERWVSFHQMWWATEQEPPLPEDGNAAQTKAAGTL